jgi:hypothetical protein
MKRKKKLKHGKLSSTQGMKEQELSTLTSALPSKTPNQDESAALVVSAWHAIVSDMEADLREGIVREGSRDMRAAAIRENGGYKLLPLRGTPEEREARAKKLSDETGGKLQAIDGTDEFVFQHVPRTQQEIRDLLKQRAETIWYYEIYRPAAAAEKEGHRIFSPERGPRCHALAEAIRTRWNLPDEENSYSQEEWDELCSELRVLRWTQGYALEDMEDEELSVAAGGPFKP